MMHRLYQGLTTLGGPLIGLYLERRKRRGKEDSARFAERLGRPARPRPAGPLVWVHGASVGESLSMLPLIERLCGRGLNVLVTTGTVTSARLMEQRLPKGALHQYVPVDRMAYVRSFLDHWRPDLALWAESEFWPNLLAESRRRGVRLVLVQGRVSPKSFAGWKTVPGFIRKLLSGFELCLAQTEGDAQRLAALGAPAARCLGNLKYAVPPLPCDPGELERLRHTMAGRPVWLASSTHPGEEVLCAQVHAALAARFPGLLTLIVPRHPPRGAEVAAELRRLGLTVALRSAHEPLAPATDIYVADTIGELGLFYRLADIVFVGKSLAVGGGQNPFEPARMGCAVLFGPAMDNFPDMVDAMRAAGAATEVADAEALTLAVGGLLADRQRTQSLKAAALAWTEAEAGVLDKVEAALAPLLGGLDKRHARP
ncbi:3-deoxy-D-manno-octulosonic acid transferase [Paramagnetospirillum marisnigri]|uniref:3-deoxy-D-manno-octulosonic acid transferase n=1 Tax=Paramagnetospirillum marisnigri TaxID=1285242 RepID=A0A178MH81_9PROT|nr:3-deoxy-D-manno-octulosonic acid transferase [Paramagnetospirillum marisnigri]OAN48016.1 3-deoxy-D-manno-octulosonic acid transferase [Paramagnetospirillum marisnigri]